MDPATIIATVGAIADVTGRFAQAATAFVYAKRWRRKSLAQAEASSDDGLGLLQLYEGDQPEADIVFIHGLNGHRERTWTGNNRQSGNSIFWIRDLLPDDLPQCRILTFGFDCDVPDAYYLLHRTLDHQASALLLALENKRAQFECRTRPIVFVAHGLGGIVLKNALLASRAARDLRTELIVECTRGAIFLGTPHQRTPSKAWSHLIKEMAIAAKVSPKILRNFEREADVLEPRLELFKSLEFQFPIITFYETRPTEGLIVSLSSNVWVLACAD